MLDPDEDGDKQQAEPNQPQMPQAPPQPPQGGPSGEQRAAHAFGRVGHGFHQLIATSQPSSSHAEEPSETRGSHPLAAITQPRDSLRSQQGQSYDELCARDWRDGPDWRPMHTPRHHQQQQRSRPISIGNAELRAAADEQRRINLTSLSQSSSADQDPQIHAIPSFPNAHQLPPAAHLEDQPQHPQCGKGRGLGRGRIIAGRHPQREQPTSPHQLAAVGRGRGQLFQPMTASVQLPLLSQLSAASPSKAHRGSSSAQSFKSASK